VLAQARQPLQVRMVERVRIVGVNHHGG